MSYRINIEVVDDEQGSVFRSETSSVEMAVDELYRFERHVLPDLEEQDEIQSTVEDSD